MSAVKQGINIQLGIMTREAGGSSIDEIARNVAASGIQTVQLTFSSIGYASFPDPLPTEFCRQVRHGFLTQGVKIPVLSGTFNSIHPDPQERREGIKGVARLVERSQDLGAAFISICTGTRDPYHMWTYHPDNRSAEAWDDLVITMRELASVAKGTGIILALEPEPGNVITSIPQALRLIDEVGADCVKILCDPGNLFRIQDLAKMEDVLSSAVLLAKEQIGLAHAKDICQPLPGETELHFTGPGSGILNFKLFVELLFEIGYQGPLIMHGLPPERIATSREYMERLLGLR